MKIAKLNDWYKKYQEIIELLILGVIIFVLWGFSYAFGFLVITSSEVLRALIEAEATIIGFFGLIAIYLLNSIDKKIERLEDYVFKIKNAPPILFKDPPSIENVDAVKRRKRQIVWGIAIESIVLIIAFFLSIMALGIVTIDSTKMAYDAKMDLALQISPVASIFLFLGIIGLSFMILRAGREF